MSWSRFSGCAARLGRPDVGFSDGAESSLGCGQAQLAKPEQVLCGFTQLGAKGKPYPFEQLHSNPGRPEEVSEPQEAQVLGSVL